MISANECGDELNPSFPAVRATAQAWQVASTSFPELIEAQDSRSGNHLLELGFSLQYEVTLKRTLQSH